MSYPHKIHPLVVEDEIDATGNYRAIFAELCKRFELAPPRFAHSFEDAEAALRTNTIFHLIVLDLGLPLHRLEPAQAGVEPGIRILEIAAEREAYPVPAVVVISGRLNRAKIPGLVEKLHSFHYGQLVSKGVDDDKEIALAVESINRYSDVGIHVQDGAGKLCPTLAPREEDILRRSVIAQNQCVGVDLQWWGSYSSNSSAPVRDTSGLTKVMVGRFLLDDGMESSHPTFFKFEPAENAAYLRRDASIMTQKLQHIKIFPAFTAGRRTLLVTQKVGDSMNLPLPLCDFLRQSPELVMPHLSGIVASICEQLAHLGGSRNERRLIKDILWPHHKREWLEKTWAEYASDSMKGDLLANPVVLFDELSTGTSDMWVGIRSCNHGDLNATNIALDHEGESVRAYIFDAGGVKGDVNCRDLATLEVTSILHRTASAVKGVVRFYEGFYERPAEPHDIARIESCPGVVCNTQTLIQEIRKQIPADDLRLYALMVLDAALVQLGGLAFDVARNKISDPSDAALLAALATKWYRRVSDPSRKSE